MTHYELLQVSQTATQVEIARAYRSLVKRCHPDRLDPVRERKLWEAANEELKLLNQAFQVLSDPHSRSDYDNMLQHPSRNEEQAAHSKRERRSPPPGIGRLVSGYSYFFSLPEAVRSRLIQRQRGTIREQQQVKTAFEQFVFYCLLGSAGALTYGLIQATEYRWTKNMTLILAIVIFLGGATITASLVWIARWARATMRGGLYATPIYIVRTHFNHVWWWPLWELVDVNLTEVFSNGSYDRTKVLLTFRTGKLEANVGPRDEVTLFLDAVKFLSRKIEQAQKSEDWDFFFSEDDFRDVRSSATPRRDSWRLVVTNRVLLAASLAGSLIVALALLVNSAQPPLRGVPTPTAQDTHSSLLAEGTHSENRPEFEPQALPQSGQLIREPEGEALAPLSIVTLNNGLHMLVKLETYMFREPVMEFFVRSGSTANVKVPLGSYRAKYAMGQVWYGDLLLFGAETSYSEVSRKLEFLEHPDHYSGYTLELFPRAEGNLQTREIGPTDW